MKKLVLISVLLIALSACFKGESVDFIVHNAKIHSGNRYDHVFEAMAIKDGIIIELGPEREILNKYQGNTLDAAGRNIYPSFTDAHGHIFWLAEKKLTCDLTGSRSMNEVINRLEKYQAQNNRKVIVGRGWDQSLWSNKELPNNEQLNLVFPDVPVILYRIDEHAVLANQAALDKAGISSETRVSGGQILQNNEGLLTGVLLDNAIDLLKNVLPKTNKEDLKKAIIALQEELLEYGISDVHEAGITLEQFRILQELEREGKLKISIYAMLFPGKQEIDFAMREGIYQSQKLLVRSFKVIGDGALGSRGACLLNPYNDAPNTHGFMLVIMDSIRRIAEIALETGFQLNVHCIGDSTNRQVLKMMAELTKNKPDHRWRIEHAQIVNPNDLQFFNNTGIIPSVQPTHAVTDMRFVQERLGKERSKHAYIYKTLLDTAKILAIGTDFPVEHFNPFLTFQAAVKRKNAEHSPKQGFQIHEAISYLDCLKGMTIWAALSSFQERKKGSLEPQKLANFIILNQALDEKTDYTKNYVISTFIEGKELYKFR
jgi:predicted amidohydrolase YtcJ